MSRMYLTWKASRILHLCIKCKSDLEFQSLLVVINVVLTNALVNVVKMWLLVFVCLWFVHFTNFDNFNDYLWCGSGIVTNPFPKALIKIGKRSKIIKTKIRSEPLAPWYENLNLPKWQITTRTANPCGCKTCTADHSTNMSDK